MVVLASSPGFPCRSTHGKPGDEAMVVLQPMIFNRNTEEVVKLVEGGMYRISRHPAYSMFMLGLWVTPKMVRWSLQIC